MNRSRVPIVPMKTIFTLDLSFLHCLLSAMVCLAGTVGIAQNPTLDSEQLAFFTLINNYRAENGTGALQVSLALQKSSQWMSNNMASKNYASHIDSFGQDAGARLAAFGYPYGPWGENIAAGFSDAQTVLNKWAAACDPDASGNCTYAHRNNMLNPAFVVIGIGRAFNANSTYGWYWTTDFGGFLDQTINLNPSSLPAVASFSANPSVITAGQSAILSWSVVGAQTVTINNRVGDVSTVTSISVAPAQTTTYTLTATAAGGTSTATVTITVDPPPDTQAPTTPTLVGAFAKSPTEVDLSWNASTDNVGVAGYQIVRNRSVLASVSANSLSYADTTASANTAYIYVVKAYDAAANYSTASNALEVITPPFGSASAPQSIMAVAGSTQSALAGSVFAAPLQAQLLDASSSPISGVTVTFSTPSSGASATFRGSAIQPSP